ncbi:MAG: pseudouridine synthase [Desulfocapsaceae bacterium]|nr:pseudouridine synthase [Desulfocapsaceae bacterium]
MAVNGPLRLQKYLAQCGLASRRKAEEMIRQGRVSVDGKVVIDMGFCLTGNTQTVRLDGKIAILQDKTVTLLLNKPKGFVTTLSDPQGRPIVTSLLRGLKVRVFPVGRLDLDTEGALILTSDGELAESIQHPRFEVKKTYEAVVSGRPARQGLNQLEQGIMLEGKKTSPASIGKLKELNHATRVTITIHEGRKRQVKKMFASIGNPVLSLKRIAYGQLFLKDLPVGAYRILTADDIKKIFL